MPSARVALTDTGAADDSGEVLDHGAGVRGQAGRIGDDRAVRVGTGEPLRRGEPHHLGQQRDAVGALPLRVGVGEVRGRGRPTRPRRGRHRPARDRPRRRRCGRPTRGHPRSRRRRARAGGAGRRRSGGCRRPGRPACSRRSRREQTLGRREVVGRGDLEVAGVARDHAHRPPNASTSMASSVAAPPSPVPARAWAARSAAARKACGVCTATSVARSSVSVTFMASSTTLMVSLGARPGIAPSTPSSPTASITAAKRAGGANGRAASCTTTMSASAGTASRPWRTESARVAPPVTTASAPSRAGSSAAGSAGTTRTTPSETRRQASTAHATTGRPPREENCFGSPKRRPEPPATTIDHTRAPLRPGRAIRSAPRSGALRRSPRPR